MLTTEQQELVTSNMRLAYYMAASWAGHPHHEDICQEAMLALCKAAATHDADRAVFSTYACACMYHAIIRYLQDEARPEIDCDTLATHPLLAVSGDIQHDIIDLYSCIRSLAREQRVIMRLVLRGKGLSDISAATHVSLSRTRTLHRAAIATICRQMGGVI
jgi:RNA polymerase sigma factor (sigma-70 family)